MLGQRGVRLRRPVAIAIAFEQLVGFAPDLARDLLRIDTDIAGNCCDSHHSQSNFFVAYAPLALGRKKLGAARSPRGGRARDRMLLVPLPEACKVKKPVQDLIVESWPVLRIFGCMRTLAQVCEDHAATCSRAAEQTDDPVFRKMLLMLGLQWKLAAQEETSKSSDICRREGESPG